MDCGWEGLKPSRVPFLIFGVAGRNVSCWEFGTSGLLADCGCEEGRAAYRAFLGSLGHRQEFLLPGPCISRPTHRLLLPNIGPFWDLQRCRWECLLQESSRTVCRLWLGWIGAQLQGHFRIYNLTKFSRLISRGFQTALERG